jgi:hypothetical protein
VSGVTAEIPQACYRLEVMKRSFFAAFLLLEFSICLCSCIGVLPMRQRTVTQQGPTAKIDLGFLKQGETPRTAVLDKLKAIDTGFASDRFFVGRWRTSKSAAWIAVGTPAGYGGFGADRLWSNTNLLVRFDDNGTIESYEMFPDKLLTQKLAPLAQQEKLLEPESLEASLTLNGTEIPVNLVLAKGSLEVEEMAHFKSLGHRPQYHYTVPRQQLQSVTVNHFQDNVTYLDVSFHFVSDLRLFRGPRGKKVTLQMSVPDLIKVLAYTLRCWLTQRNTRLRSEAVSLLVLRHN